MEVLSCGAPTYNGGRLTARAGFQVFDSDIHVGPSMDVLSAYLSDAEKATLDRWDEYRVVDKYGP